MDILRNDKKAAVKVEPEKDPPSSFSAGARKGRQTPREISQWGNERISSFSNLLAITPEPDRRKLLKQAISVTLGFQGTVMACVDFATCSPEVGWDLLEQLLLSLDARERGLGVAVFAKLRNPRSYPLVKPLLADPDLSVRLKAVDFLQKVYPEESIAALQDLLASGRLTDTGPVEGRLRRLRRSKT